MNNPPRPATSLDNGLTRLQSVVYRADNADFAEAFPGWIRPHKISTTGLTRSAPGTEARLETARFLIRTAWIKSRQKSAEEATVKLQAKR